MGNWVAKVEKNLSKSQLIILFLTNIINKSTAKSVMKKECVQGSLAETLTIEWAVEGACEEEWVPPNKKLLSARTSEQQ